MLLELMRQGGAIMWIIAASGLAALFVFIERSLHLHRARIKADDFLRGIYNIVGRGNITEAITICEETPGPVAYIIKTAILHRQDAKEAIQTAVADASRGEISRMERRLVLLATVAQTAPLLGLLGTVLGMLQALLAMESAAPLIHTGDVLGGLRSALLTTAGGLSVAIPCYMAFNLLIIKIDRIVLDMERAASEMIAFLKGGWQSGEQERSAPDVGREIAR
ncbi:MAG: MotA/TolQ/ExbB proton channel family protein [Lentisphaerae bacterium]|nr:MotA/TolQ/ExbB proton channel family protein [Lentisphaerota bacterium]